MAGRNPVRYNRNASLPQCVHINTFLGIFVSLLLIIIITYSFTDIKCGRYAFMFIGSFT